MTESFDSFVDSTMKSELERAVNERGCILETNFVSELLERYGFSRPTIRYSLHKIAKNHPYIVFRRLNNELKAYYGMEHIAGYPAIFCRK